MEEKKPARGLIGMRGRGRGGKAGPGRKDTKKKTEKEPTPMYVGLCYQLSILVFVVLILRRFYFIYLFYFSFINRVPGLALGEETTVHAVVGSIVWAFRRLKKPRCREMSARGYALHSVRPQLSFSFLFHLDLIYFILIHLQ